MKTRQDALELMQEWVESDSLRKHCLSVAASMEAYAEKFLSENPIKNKFSSKITDDINSSKDISHPTSQVNNKKHDNSSDVNDSNLGKSDSYDNSVGDGCGGHSKQEIIDKYWITGVLHDFDWEKNPSLEGHPVGGVKVLREKGWDEEICLAILGHGNHTGVARESLLAKTLFAVDELSGLIVALARVRPGNFSGMSAKSVRKAMKKKDFAATINREDINQGVEELGLESDEEKNAHFELVIRAQKRIKEEWGFRE